MKFHRYCRESKINAKWRSEHEGTGEREKQKGLGGKIGEKGPIGEGTHFRLGGGGTKYFFLVTPTFGHTH